MPIFHHDCDVFAASRLQSCFNRGILGSKDVGYAWRNGMSDHSGYKKPTPPGGPLDFSDKWGGREESTPIELVDKLLATLPEGHPARFDLFRLRQQIQEHELTLSEARAAIEKMD